MSRLQDKLAIGGMDYQIGEKCFYEGEPATIVKSYQNGYLQIKLEDGALKDVYYDQLTFNSKEASLQKTAADLGEKNIPENILMQVSPAPLQVLYWREEATNVPNTTVELWRLQDGSFGVFAGTYDGTWETNNVMPVTNDKGENTFSNLTDAMKAIRTNYVFETLPLSPEEVQMMASKKTKRLLRKSER